MEALEKMMSLSCIRKRFLFRFNRFSVPETFRMMICQKSRDGKIKKKLHFSKFINEQKSPGWH